MKRTCIALFLSLLVAGVAVPVQPAGSSKPAVAEDPEQQLAQLDQELTSEQTRLTDLNNQVEQAQGQLDLLNRKLQGDQAREKELDKEVSALARSEYQRPALTISTILDAPTLQELISNLAQARLVSHRQQNLQSEAKRLRRQDEQIRDQQAVKLAQVQDAKKQAADIVVKTLTLRNQVSDQVLAQKADLVGQQAQATAAVVTGANAPGTIEAPGANHFAYGYCTWYVANRRYIPWMGNAIDWWPNARPYGYAEGGTPAVGAVMVTRESSVGHVAYVESVNSDGSWTVSEMNYVGWNIVSRRTIHPGQIPLVGFIYGKS
jgi:surface antigen